VNLESIILIKQRDCHRRQIGVPAARKRKLDAADVFMLTSLC
jgi:hypothetical protein